MIAGYGKFFRNSVLFEFCPAASEGVFYLQGVTYTLQIKNTGLDPKNKKQFWLFSAGSQKKADSKLGMPLFP